MDSTALPGLWDPEIMDSTALPGLWDPEIMDSTALPGLWDPETVLRRLIDLIVFVDCSVTANNFSNNGSMADRLEIKFVQGPDPDILYVEFSDILAHWIRRLGGCAHADGRSLDQVENFVLKILNEKIPKSLGCDDLCKLIGWGRIGSILVPSPHVSSSVGEVNKQFADAVMWLREIVALNPGCMASDYDSCTVQKQKKMILDTGRVLIQRNDDNLNIKDFARKRQRYNRHLDEASKAASGIAKSQLRKRKNSDSIDLSERRSQRHTSLLKILETHLPRKRVPIGSSFQAQLPVWTGKRRV